MKCLRCKNELSSYPSKYSSAINYICKCGMKIQTVEQYPSKKQFITSSSLEIGEYLINWYDTICSIDVRVNDFIFEYKTTLLSKYINYDITEEKIKMMLTFS